MTTLRNSVHLIGRLGNDPEMKNVSEDRKVVRFSMATNDYYRDHKGNQVQDTQWHNIVAWGKTAEIAEKLLKKGKEAAVAGKLINRSWEDDNGMKHYITEVVASEIMAFGKEG